MANQPREEREAGEGTSELSDLELDPAMRRWLDAPASLAGREARDVEWLTRGMATNLSMEVVARGDTSGLKPPWNRVSIPRQAQGACLAFLRRRAAELRVGRALEAARSEQRRRPEEPGLAKAWDRLVPMRDEAREATGPVAAREGWLTIREDPLRLEFELDGLAWCEHSDPRRPYWRSRDGGVTIALDDEALPVAVSCARGRGPCHEVTAALEAVLDLLGAPEDAERPLRSKLAECFGRPRWERDLAAIERAVAAVEPSPRTWDGEDVELGWIVERPWDAASVKPVEVRPKKRGDGFVTRPIDALDAIEGGLLELPADREALQLLRAADGTRGAYYRDEGVGAEELQSQALLALVGHPRVFVRHQGSTRVRVRRGRWSLAIVQREEAIEVVVVDETGESISPSDAADRLDRPYGIKPRSTVVARADLDAEVLTVAEVSRELATIVEALAEGHASFPAEAAERLPGLVMGLARHAPLVVDDALAGARVEADATPWFRLELDAGEGLNVSLRCRPLEGAPEQVPGEGAERLYAARDGRLIHARRELEAEAVAADALVRELGLEPNAAGHWVLEEREAALGLLHRLAQRPEVVVQWRGGRKLTVGRGTTSDLVVGLRTKRDWFDVQGSFRLSHGNVGLGAVLAAMEKGQEFVRVEGDVWMRIDRTLRRALAPVAAAIDERRGELQTTKWAAPVFEELAAAGARIDAPEAWTSLLSRLEESAELRFDVPEGFVGELRPYQRAGYEWMMRLAHWGAGGVLADDMGLGKTVQALAMLQARREEGPALVVAPTSVGFNWQRECHRFTPELEPRLFRGKGQEDKLADLGPGDVVITSYDLIARYSEAFAQPFATLILDEAQAIKNPSTRRAKAIFALDAAMRFALTGTPLENRTGELWSIFRAVAPGLLGTKRSFKERFAKPIERDGDRERRESLARIVRPFVLRRMKSQVARDLPPRTDVTLDVELSQAERERYDELRDAAAIHFSGIRPDDSKRARFQLLAAITRLRQLACHPRLVDPDSDAPSAKLEALLELVDELRSEGHRALIFSQFTTLLGFVREALDARGVTYQTLDGSTPELERRRAVDAFQAGRGEVFLLSLKAGGTGLNLTAANYVIHLDPWWNPAVEDQATDRAHRIGQEDPVTVYRLVTRDTIEETILRMQDDKRELVDALLEGTGSAGALTTDQLLELVRGSASESLEAAL